MLKITIRAIGRLAEKWQREAVEMYEERLQPFCRLTIVELPEGHGGSAKPDISKTQSEEKRSLERGIPADAYVIALDERGKSLDSATFAKTVGQQIDEGREIIFLIGGSWGLDKELRLRADLVLSLGAMTFPHGIARVLLMEQLYRAMMIKGGREYHK